MKKTLASIFFIAILIHCNAQDIIVKSTSEQIKATKIEINENDIRYKKFDEPDGNTYLIFKKDILLIKFENGEFVEFKPTNAIENNQKQTITGAEEIKHDRNYYYERGKADAKKYYKGYKVAGSITLGATIFPYTMIYGGVITALATSLTPPQKHNLNYPDKNLMQNADYATGYLEEAKRIKSKKVWSNFGYGAGAIVGVYAAVIGLLVLSYY